MKRPTRPLPLLLAFAGGASVTAAVLAAAPAAQAPDLGTFSMSLAVADLSASRAFYEALGFTILDGSEDQDWLILRNGEAKIGLFEGMFPDNTLTFNPPDVRAVQRALKAAGIELAMEADESTAGPAAASLFDPDGNPILLDQH